MWRRRSPLRRRWPRYKFKGATFYASARTWTSSSCSTRTPVSLPRSTHTHARVQHERERNVCEARKHVHVACALDPYLCASACCSVGPSLKVQLVGSNGRSHTHPSLALTAAPTPTQNKASTLRACSSPTACSRSTSEVRHNTLRLAHEEDARGAAHHRSQVDSHHLNHRVLSSL